MTGRPSSFDWWTRSVAPRPDVAVTTNATGVGGTVDVQSMAPQSERATWTRPGPVGPSITASRPTPLPGSLPLLIVPSAACTSPVAPVQSPYPAMSTAAAPAAVPGPSENGTRNNTDGAPMFPSWP